VDAIVCVDANFSQKRRKSQGNAWVPPRQHCESVFISPTEVGEMEALVDETRNPKHGGPGVKARNRGYNDEPDFEPGLRVPTVILDACNDSFVAADSNRVKASTSFFSDTGLMALLCRHDCVLWLVNMTSAGEKQHYVLCLLQKLFEHIPRAMRIGLLYDVGCHLHRSCEKFDFLSDYRDRIIFGISVFHAYGHQWACQIIYYPRKCKGFGLSDGEECERFWSSIKPLIPSLRVSGYFNRIYTLDAKVRHLDIKSKLGLGRWLKRRWTNTIERNQGAMEVLESVYSSGVTEEILRVEWDKQVFEQRKPLAKQSDQLAKLEIEAILALYKNMESHNAEIESYEIMLENDDYEHGFTATEVQAALEDVQQKVVKNKRLISARKSKLSVDGRLNLTKLLDNEFLKLRMRALALKQRIRDRLRQRKFELENLERAYRKTVNHLKLEKHAQTQLKRKEPGIQATAKKYNQLCLDLKKIIDNHGAPRGAISPLPIALDGLFKLDIDDDIWQDIGLTSETDDMTEIPAWLGNIGVRDGIKALLEHDRCVEEMKRVKHERVCMQEWFKEEWEVVEEAIVITEDVNVLFQLNRHRDDLLRLCVTWELVVRGIPCTMSKNNWGPSLGEMKKAYKYEFQKQVVQHSDSDTDLEDENSDLDDKESIEDAEFIDNLEMSAFFD
jgi:hypothetical protein